MKLKILAALLFFIGYNKKNMQVSTNNSGRNTNNTNNGRRNSNSNSNNSYSSRRNSNSNSNNSYSSRRSSNSNSNSNNTNNSAQYNDSIGTLDNDSLITEINSYPLYARNAIRDLFHRMIGTDQTAKDIVKSPNGPYEAMQRLSDNIILSAVEYNDDNLELKPYMYAWVSDRQSLLRSLLNTYSKDGFDVLSVLAPPWDLSRLSILFEVASKAYGNDIEDVYEEYKQELEAKFGVEQEREIHEALKEYIRNRNTTTNSSINYLNANVVQSTNTNKNVSRNANTNTNANANSSLNGSAFCETLVVDVNDAFKKFAKEISKICNSLNKDKLILNKYDMNLASRGWNKIPSIRASQDKPLDSLIRMLSRQSLSKTPVFLKDYKEVKYIGNAGIGPGVARDFFTACVKQCEDELFQQVEESDLYDLRNDLDINNIDIKRKLKVLGFLIGVMVCNELTFSFKVKRALIHMCLYNQPPKDASFLVYHMLEDPEATISVINLMKKPENIELSYLDFEDIGKPEQLVTSSNYREFLLAKEEFNIPQTYKLVAQGFALAGFDKLFVTMGNSVSSLHKALCMTEITNEVRKGFVKQIDFGGSISDSVKKWFTEIILTIEPDFLRKLIHFWSASYGITKDKTYQVIEGQRVITKQVCPLTESHTCYYQLVLPQGIESKEKLLENLQTSVGNVSKGVALYGGNNRKIEQKEYTTYKNRKYVVHKGGRGGKYIIKKGEKKYLKNNNVKMDK